MILFEGNNMFNFKKVARQRRALIKQGLRITEQDAIITHMKGTINRLCDQLSTKKMMPKLRQGLPKVSNPGMLIEVTNKPLKRPWGLISTHLRELVTVNEMVALYDAISIAKLISKSNPVYEAATMSQVYQCKEWATVMALRKSIRTRKNT
jgi:hypothetical protein